MKNRKKRHKIQKYRILTQKQFLWKKHLVFRKVLRTYRFERLGEDAEMQCYNSQSERRDDRVQPAEPAGF